MPRDVSVEIKLKQIQENELLFCSVTGRMYDTKKIILNSLEQK
jgi:hypothetical protein